MEVLEERRELRARGRKNEKNEKKKKTHLFFSFLVFFSFFLPITRTTNRRINAEITARIAAGEDLPPPPKTAIAGPEYFGFCQPEIAGAIEALDPEHRCSLYWAGKEERIAAMAGLPPPTYAAAADAGGGGGEGGSSSRAARAPKASRPVYAGGLARKGARRSRRSSDDSDDDNDRRRRNDEEDEEEDPEARIGNRFSSGVSRAERYRKRARNNSGDGGNGENDENGGDGGNATANDLDPENPLPGFIDPITLAPVVDPAIAPSGHVCGMATWKAVLRSTAGGGSSVCPFTKKPLSWEQCVRLTHNNVERYRDRIRT